MRRLAALALVLLIVTGLGCHDYRRRLRDFGCRDAEACGEPMSDMEADTARDASDSAFDAAADGEDPALACASRDASDCGVAEACEGVVCPSKARCRVVEGDASCECLTGHVLDEARTTCVDLDECALEESPCDVLTSCENLEGGYACGACPPTYTGIGEAICLPLLTSLSVTPGPEALPIELDIARDAHPVRVPLATEQVWVTATFLPTRWATAFGTLVTSGETWSSPALSPGNNFIPIELHEGLRSFTYVVAPQRGLQEAYIKASNTAADDRFGASVALSGNTIVVGAPGQSGAPGGVDAPQDIGGAMHAGAAYVFVRDSSHGNWEQQVYLKASAPTESDGFGARVAIDGDTVVVGAFLEDSGGADPFGDDLDASGAVYVFVRSQGTWSQQAMLKASDAGGQGFFGESVAISSDTIVVGSPNHEGRGAAYVFVRTNDSWTEQARLVASNAGIGDGFGEAVAIRDDTLIVGAPAEASDATGVNGEQDNDNATGSGAAYVFQRGSSGWMQTAYLKPNTSASYDAFGQSLAFDGATLVVGAPFENSSRGGINGSDSDEAAPHSGAAYVFAPDGRGFRQVARIKSHAPIARTYFGQSVAVHDGRIAIGARDPSGAVLFNASNDEDIDETRFNAGAVYLFERTNAGWARLAYVKPEHPRSHAYFGVPKLPSLLAPQLKEPGCIALDGDTIVVGASGESSDARGVDGDPLDESAPGSGAVYVFR